MRNPSFKEIFLKVKLQYFSNVTTKIKSFEDLNELKTYGYHGESLFNMIIMSEKIEILTSNSDSDVLVRKTIENEIKRSFLCNLKNSGFKKGTRVCVYSLFNNLKTRREQLNEYFEVKSIKKRLEEISLLHYNISISLNDVVENKILFKTFKHDCVKEQFAYLFGNELKTSLKEYSLNDQYFDENARYFIKGLFSIYTHNKPLQFVYVNNHCIENLDLYAFINKELSLLKFNQKDNFKNPVYVIFIKCPFKHYYLCNTGKNTKIVLFSCLDYIKCLLRRLISKFVNDEGYKMMQVVDGDNSLSLDTSKIKTNLNLNCNFDSIEKCVVSKVAKKMNKNILATSIEGQIIENASGLVKRKLNVDNQMIKKFKRSKSIQSTFRFNATKLKCEEKQHELTREKFNLMNQNFLPWFDLYHSKGQIESLNVKASNKYATDFVSDELIEISKEKTKDFNLTRLTRAASCIDLNIKSPKETKETKLNENCNDCEVIYEAESFENKNIWSHLFKSFKPRPKLDRFGADLRTSHNLNDASKQYARNSFQNLQHHNDLSYKKSNLDFTFYEKFSYLLLIF